MTVIFSGMYLSHLIFIEEGNKDFVVGKPGMINFNKRLVKILFPCAIRCEILQEADC